MQAGLIPGGYAMEFAIPLSLINTVNAPGDVPAGPGSQIKFNVAGVDDDVSNGTQQRYGVLWEPSPGTSPFLSGEAAWVADLYLNNGQPANSSAPLLVNAPLLASAPQFSALLDGDGTTTGNVVQGNMIGTNAAGSAALANHGDGVSIESGATANTIGGTATGARNVISGNTSDGVEITGAGTTGNVVEGDFIGTNAAGSAAIANYAGVEIDSGATGNTDRHQRRRHRATPPSGTSSAETASPASGSPARGQITTSWPATISAPTSPARPPCQWQHPDERFV